MPRGKKNRVSVVEVLPPPASPPPVDIDLTPIEDESPTPPIQAVLGHSIESAEAAAAIQRHIADFLSPVVSGETADNTYTNPGGVYDSMETQWNPSPPTQTDEYSAIILLGDEVEKNNETISGVGQPDINGWYTAGLQSAPPPAAGGAATSASVRSDTPRPTWTSTSSISPHLMCDDTTTSLSKSASSGRKRSAPSLNSDDKKKKRQKKVKVVEINDAASYSDGIPLTASSWPANVNLPAPTPERVFYPFNAPNSLIEVYVHPNYPGVGVVQYAGAPYERRLNLSVDVFKKLYEISGTVLDRWSAIQKDGDSGLTSTSHSFRADLDTAGVTQLLVTLYKGRPKLHIGTRSYIDQMLTGTIGSQRQVRTPEHCGHALGIHVMRDISERVGRVLTDYRFYPTMGVV